MYRKTLFLLAAAMAAACTGRPDGGGKVCFSGVYPELAYYNNEGECGTGAVVPWADRLWVITYSPHSPWGSSDKLYEISGDLDLTVRPESIGGTPANRMIHRESGQLFIGPHVIDTAGNVRTIPYSDMPGRHTGMARHIDEPEGKIYLGTMEEGFYSIDVNTLDHEVLYEDGNVIRRKQGAAGKRAQFGPLLPGCHGKGLYSGQGVMAFSNNGEDSEEAHWMFDIEAGCLAEWDGKDWKVIRRNQFTEITGPGGIYGNANPETDPIWALGWDYKSVVLGVRDAESGWDFYRLPKASFTYDGAHGWNTEWPRIRNVGTEGQPDYLMTMHGMFWRFPGSFAKGNTAGISPRGAYLKVIGDFAEWNGRLVFGCDDSAANEFLNKRKAKGNIEAAGQSNSNLWFTSLDGPDNIGPVTAGGALWLREDVEAGVPSEPFLFEGWPERCAWLSNGSDETVEYTFQVDAEGNGTWTDLRKVKLDAHSSRFMAFDAGDKGVWIRAVADKPAFSSIQLAYSTEEKRGTSPDPIFKGLAKVTGNAESKGLLYSLGGNRRTLGVLAETDGRTQFYEADNAMNLTAKDDPKTVAFMEEKFTIPQNMVEVDGCSVLVVDEKGRRWRLPMGDSAFDRLTVDGSMRLCREVATERDLFNCHGTFYELPAENADGYAKIRPVSSHGFAINDYASYRGLLVMTGTDGRGRGNSHIVRSDDGKAAVWAGVIDDLWKLGKPVGHGSVWNGSPVQAGYPSDPYLIWGYDDRTVTLENNGDKKAVFTIEADPTGDGEWMTYMSFDVEPGQSVSHVFPAAFLARWVRAVSDTDTKATVSFEYR